MEYMLNILLISACKKNRTKRRSTKTIRRSYWSRSDIILHTNISIIL